MTAASQSRQARGFHQYPWSPGLYVGIGGVVEFCLASEIAVRCTMVRLTARSNGRNMWYCPSLAEQGRAIVPVQTRQQPLPATTVCLQNVT